MHLSDVSGTLRPSVARSKVDSAVSRFGLVAPRLGPALNRSVEARNAELGRVSFRFVSRLIHRKINETNEAYQQTVKNLSRAANLHVGGLKDRLTALERLRETLGYKATLNRGYAVVRSGDTVITTTKAASSAEALEIEFSDGRLSMPGKPKSAKRSPTPGSAQGSLF
jgi:exodeoxyribonuclease VII large subunit